MEIPVVFHYGMNYDYHFIMKEIANEFVGEFNCLEENAEKYKTFSATVIKVKKICKTGKEIAKTISYKWKFIVSTRFLASSLSSLPIILLKEFIKLNVNMDMVIKNVKHMELITNFVIAILNTQALRVIS